MEVKKDAESCMGIGQRFKAKCSKLKRETEMQGGRHLEASHIVVRGKEGSL